MFRIYLTVMLVCLAVPSFAEDRLFLGKARIFNNDLIGDGHDRWRTGSYALSVIKGRKWRERLPDRAGDLLEYRLRTEIIAPANLANPAIGTDRRYVGAVSFGVFTHFQSGATEMSTGLDLVVTGPQTGLGGFHTWAHKLIGGIPPAVLGSQIGNGIYPTVSFEAARTFNMLPDIGEKIAFRPFFEAQAGVETFVRIGADFTFGNLGHGDLRVRDVVTGQRVVAVKADRAGGSSFVIGADVAYVVSSVYLPSSSGFVLTNPRVRIRSGNMYEGKNASIFYGLTWLSKEFAAQPESQIVGSLSIKFRF